MAYTVHIREMARRKIAAMAEDMSRWETKERIDDEEADFIRKAIRGFAHTATAEPFNMGGVDGSGDYPSFSYADSFVYVASASGTMYRTDATHGLVEVKALDEPNLEFVWLPENTDEAMTRWLAALDAGAGPPVDALGLIAFRLFQHGPKACARATAPSSASARTSRPPAWRWPWPRA